MKELISLETTIEIVSEKEGLAELATPATQDVYDAFEYVDIKLSDDELTNTVYDILFHTPDFDEVISRLPDLNRTLTVKLVKGRSTVNGLSATPGNVIYLFLASNGWSEQIENLDCLEYLLYHELGHHIYGQLIQCYGGKLTKFMIAVNNNIRAMIDEFNRLHKLLPFETNPFDISDEYLFQETFADLFAVYASFVNGHNYMKGEVNMLYKVFSSSLEVKQAFISTYDKMLGKIKEVN